MARTPELGAPFIFEGDEYVISELQPERRRVRAGRQKGVGKGETLHKRITMSSEEITWLEPGDAAPLIAAEIADWIGHAKNLVSIPRTKDGESPEEAAARELAWEAERKQLTVEVVMLGQQELARWATRTAGAWMLPMRLLRPVRPRPALELPAGVEG